MILIDGFEIEAGARARLLLGAEEEFELEYIDTREYDGQPLRRFRILQDGKNQGIVYEDQLAPEVIELLEQDT